MQRLLRWPGNIPLFSELALVIALAWVVSGWLLPDVEPTSPMLQQAISNTSPALPDLQTLTAIHLFGTAAAHKQATKPAPPVAKPVTISPLHIKLLGTVVADTHAAAIIATAAGREQRAFFIGDSIQPGVVLKIVEADAIVVERGGRMERIYLEKNSPLVSSPMGVIGANLRSSSMPARQIPPKTMPTYPPTASAAGGMRKQISRQHLQQQLKNFPALLSQARVIPRMVNGKPSGFTISEIAPGSLYQQAGLRNGDIILSINGKRITDAKQAMRMYQTLQNAPALDLMLIRAGQTRQIHYDIR